MQNKCEVKDKSFSMKFNVLFCFLSFSRLDLCKWDTYFAWVRVGKEIASLVSFKWIWLVFIGDLMLLSRVSIYVMQQSFRLAY